MSDYRFVQLILLVITIGSVVLPFAFPVRQDPRDQPFVTVPLDVFPRLRHPIAASFFLLMIPFGIYALFKSNQLDVWSLMGAPAVILIALIELLPDRMIRRFIYPIGKVYLAALGIVLVAATTLSLLRAVLLNEIALRSLGTGVPYVWRRDESASLFWYYIIGSVIVNFATVRALREWFVLRKRTGTHNPGDHRISQAATPHTQYGSRKTDTGDNKSIVRILAAMDGFFVKFGTWPTRMLVSPIILRSVEDTLTPEQFSRLTNRVELVPDDIAMVVAENEIGHRYDYAKHGFPGTKPAVRAREWLNL